MVKRMRLVLLVAAAQVFTLVGCDSTSNEALPNIGSNLCLNIYEQCVDNILHASITSGGITASCSQAGCHNITPPTTNNFLLTPNPAAASPEMAANMMAAASRATNNLLLLKPLAGTTAHAGGDRFQSASDPCYQAIANWINQPVTNPATCATLPPCTPVANPAAQCGN